MANTRQIEKSLSKFQKPMLENISSFEFGIFSVKLFFDCMKIADNKLLSRKYLFSMEKCKKLHFKALFFRLEVMNWKNLFESENMTSIFEVEKTFII